MDNEFGITDLPLGATKLCTCANSMTYAHFGRCTRRCRKEARVMMKISHLLKTHLVLRIWFHKSMVKLLLSLTPSTGWGLNRSMVAADALIDSQQWDQSMWMDWNAPCVWSSKSIHQQWSQLIIDWLDNVWNAGHVLSKSYYLCLPLLPE
jgi:predicted ATPase with chaperone activity